jgi:hypothetical protein
MPKAQGILKISLHQPLLQKKKRRRRRRRKISLTP